MSTWAKDEKGYTICVECRARWTAGDRQRWWPIRLKWSNSWAPLFFRHGVQQGVDAQGRRIFSTTIHLGRLKLILGSRRNGYPQLTQCCPVCGAVHWQAPVRSQSSIGNGARRGRS